MGLGMSMRDPNKACDADKSPSQVGDADEKTQQGSHGAGGADKRPPWVRGG